MVSMLSIDHPWSFSGFSLEKFQLIGMAEELLLLHRSRSMSICTSRKIAPRQLPILPWMAGSRATHMYRMYGQMFAPAISALPPSMVVVVGQRRSSCRGAAKAKWCAEERPSRTIAI